jgi:outer membrane protein TolC
MKMLLLFLASCAAAAAQTASTDTLALNDLLRIALQNNPELRAYTQAHHAAEARVPQMSSLDDPRFALEIEEAPARAPFNASQWRMLNFGLTQMLPFPGKLGKAKRLGEIEVAHAHHELAEKALEVMAQVKAAYFELYMIQRGLEVNQENINLMTQFVNVARVRYAVGQVMNQDVLKANVELARLANAQITLQQEEEIAKAMLNALLNRPPQAPLGQAVVPERDSLSLDLKTLHELAFASRPMLHHDSLSITQSRVAHSLARQQYWPDFEVSLKYVASPDDGFRGLTAMAGASLPFAFWSIKKQRGRVAETEAELRRDEAMFANTRNMILFSVQAAFTKVQSAQRTLALYRDVILPQAEQALQVTLANYQTRQTDFLMLLDGYRMLQMSKMEFYEAEAKLEMSLAELERAVGGRF